MHNFRIDAELSAATVTFARQLRGSAFMVLLAAFYLVAHLVTGETDPVASKFTTGRNDPRFRDGVGTFFNFLPIRTHIAGCASFRDIVAVTRSNCLEAYTHDVPFAHIEPVIPELWPRGPTAT